MESFVRRSPRTSFNTHCPALLICDVESGREELDALELAERMSVPVTVLGEGTNVLFSDDGWPGVIIRPVTDPGGTIWPQRDYQDSDGISVKAYASAVWDEVAALAVKEGWPGAECLSGIPGTAGAAPVQNIGAYGQQISDLIETVTVVDLKTRTLRIFSREDCGFGYRTSIFNRPENADRFVIAEVVFRFRRAGAPCRTYPEVAARTTPHSTLTEVREVVMSLRRSKGMLAGQHQSAGSFFKNPVVSGEVAERVIDRTGGAGWFWPTPGGVKLSAARLIETAGFRKGQTRGKAAISPQHSLSLVNLGNASASEICGLAYEIQERVYDVSRILLEPEVRLIGFSEYPLLRV